MIAYEELEKALTRWKARRSNAPEGQAVQGAQAANEGQGGAEGEGVVQGPDTTESQEVAAGPVTAPVPADAPGEVHPAYQNPDSTGELDLTDADVSEA